MERKVYSAILREDRETDIQFNFDRIWVDTNTIAMLVIMMMRRQICSAILIEDGDTDIQCNFDRI